ncbi:MAG: hypothetical protein ABIJ81_04510 [Patescibacteria group bacterium]
MPQELPKISNQEFKFGYWFFMHRDLFKKVIIGVLVLLIVVFWGFSLVKLVSYLATSKAHNEMLENLTGTVVESSAWHTRNQPEEIQVLQVTAIPVGKTYDIVALIKNPNLRWAAAKVDYVFLSNGSEQIAGTGYLMPLEEKYFLESNVDLGLSASEVSLEIRDVNWYRIRNFTEFPNASFDIADQQLVNLATLSPGSQGMRLRVDLTNISAYSFWEINVQAILKSGSMPVAVATKPVQIMESGKTKSLEFIWTSPLPNVTNIEIKPEVNVLDASVFKPL